MNTENLRTFVNLSETLNFSRTAETLLVAQSTVTKRIRELESEMGRRLLDRSKRHVALTDAGMTLLPYAQRILDLETASLKEVGSTGLFTQTLRVGATNSAYECYLPPLVAHYRAIPHHAVQLKIGHSLEMLQQMQDNVLDIVFSSVAFRKKGYLCQKYASEELVLVADGKDRTAEEGIHKEQLVEMDYLMCDFALNETGRYIRGLFPKRHQFSLEVDNSTKLISYLENGQGCSFLPQSMVQEQLAAKTLRVIPLLDFDSPIIETYCVGRESKESLWRPLIERQRTP